MPESEATRRPLGEDREDRHMVHVHVFNTLTGVADDHQHLVQGTTGPARDAGPSHVHRIRVRTSYWVDHWHWLDIITGPAVYILDSGHVHAFEGETSFDDRHCHVVFDTTTQSSDFREEEPAEPPPPPAAKPKTGKR